jgi:hypothetical protein
LRPRHQRHREHRFRERRHAVFAPTSAQTINVAIAGGTSVEATDPRRESAGATNGALLDANATGTIVDDGRPPRRPIPRNTASQAMQTTGERATPRSP